MIYRVWIAQINQTYVDVAAVDVDSASKKAERIWMRDFACPFILDIKEIPNGPDDLHRTRNPGRVPSGNRSRKG